MRSRTLGLAVLAALIATGAVGASAATAPKPVKSADPKGDVTSTLDLTRVSLTRGSDGRLRASVTLAAEWDGKALLAESGPPGSICLKAWTTTAPPDTTPDYLVCVTADAKGVLRGSVLHERANKLPERVAAADVSRPSARTVTMRFSQSALGSPAKLYVAAESTRPGCPRVSCIDTAPDAPKTLTFALKAAAK
ncbi:MAG TPA: hypothetical protein VGO71_10055 [Baekduia sp.]|jgi:hypothetical protein|nr:hypothetical protein [Baekduia sp.]